jgi:flagellar hook-associated protein 2
MALSAAGNTLLDQYVNSYINTQMYRYDPYDLKDAQLKQKQNFFTQLNGRLNSLLSAMDRFGSYKNVISGEGDDAVIYRRFVPANNYESSFVTRKVTASQSDFLSASAKGTALTGLNNVKVVQLATTDSYIGKQVNIEDTLSTSGTLKFTINVGGTDKEFTISYTAGETNEDLMKRIVSLVNKTGSEGLGDKVNAAFVKDTTGTARLTFSSKGTGAENALSFSVDSGSTAMATAFGIVDTPTRSAVYDDTDADSFGFQKGNADALNSKINVNGVTVTRSSNSITDAIDGVTLTLKKAHSDGDAATTLNTEIDTKAVINLIDPLMSAFNNISNFINTNKDAHGKDPAMIGLGNTLRGLVSESLIPRDPDQLAAFIAKADYKNPETEPIQYLAQLGFKMSADGVLSLADMQKFEDLLLTEDGAKIISDAILSFSEKVSQYMDNLTARDSNQGLIKSRLSSISQQIDANNKKIAQIDKSLDKMEASVRKQYTAYLSAYYNAQNQAALLSTFQYMGGGNAFDSLVAQQAQR